MSTLADLPELPERSTSAARAAATTTGPSTGRPAPRPAPGRTVPTGGPATVAEGAPRTAPRPADEVPAR
ncbi:hypothetical protein [Kitasatospora herbaricolor]|uniref:Uncharacterized protein n=1 Tax=Kitasatospora herbaricolor TaxID=68217 RepID=A0ABZ1WJQ1_9ACTN|nr:hypothetical protein [Kitasatospora herbaricolor]